MCARNNILMLPRALELAELGFRLFPAHNRKSSGCSCGDSYCSEAVSHPRIPDWQEVATREEFVLREWWTKWPEANIGAVTDDYIVLDVEPCYGGDWSVEQLRKQFGPMPRTWTIASGRGGYHYWFSAPDLDIRAENCIGKFPSIAVRAAGGYSLLPPSTNGAGQRLSWILSPKNTRIASVPDWIVEELEKPSSDSIHEIRQKYRDPDYHPTALGSKFVRRAIFKAAHRDRSYASGIWLACQLRDHGFNFWEAERLMQEYADRLYAKNFDQCVSPYSSKLALASLNKVYAKPSKGPWYYQVPVGIRL